MPYPGIELPSAIVETQLIPVAVDQNLLGPEVVKNLAAGFVVFSVDYARFVQSEIFGKSFEFVFVYLCFDVLREILFPFYDFLCFLVDAVS